MCGIRKKKKISLRSRVVMRFLCSEDIVSSILTEGSKMIEKCENIRRVIKSPRLEIQYCSETGGDMGCGGFSDHCPVPELFKSIRGVPNSEITFIKDIPRTSKKR